MADTSVEDRAPGRGSGRAALLIALNVAAVALLPIWFLFLGVSVMGFDSTGTEKAPIWVWTVFWGNAVYPVLLAIGLAGTWIAWFAGSPRWARRLALVPGAWVVFMVGFFVFAVVSSA